MGVSGRVVVDASVAVKWLVREEDTDKALAILRTWENEEVTPAAPHLLPFEVANALHQKVVRGQMSLVESTRMIAELLGSPLELHQSSGLHARALELADELRQGAVYDAHYLALAEELDCEFWTADRRLHRAGSDRGRHVRWLGEFAIP